MFGLVRRINESVLARPSVFGSYQAAIGAPECHRTFIQQYVRPEPGQRVLDVGCGTGASVKFIPTGVDYVGFDIEPRYIAAAQATYGARGTFVCSDLSAVRLDAGTIDTAFAFGVLHHLSDDTIVELAALLRHVLRPGGVFVSIDPCWVPSQGVTANVMMRFDRGRHIRTEQGYRTALHAVGAATTEVRLDLLNIRYGMVVCRVGAAA